MCRLRSAAVAIVPDKVGCVLVEADSFPQNSVCIEQAHPAWHVSLLEVKQTGLNEKQARASVWNRRVAMFESHTPALPL